jgi:asparagine synthase (glutamine-hydrolysing)
VKPFYYYFDGRRFVFASEIKAILCCPFVPRRPNPNRAYDYLFANHLDNPPETFFENIVQLPASHAILLSTDEIKKWQYYRIDPEKQISFSSQQEVCEQFRSLVEDSIALRFVSDVPVASTLSGGLDSTTVVSLAVQHLRNSGGLLPHQVFSACFANSPEDERPFIDMASRELPLLRHDVLLSADNLLDRMEEQTRRQDQPVMSAAMIAKGDVMKAVSEHGIKVVLEGQGVDEWCCGYNNAALPAIADDLRSGRWVTAARHLRNYCSASGAALRPAISSATDLAFPKTKSIFSGVKATLRVKQVHNGTSWLSSPFKEGKKPSRPRTWARGALNDYCLRSMFDNHLPFYLRSDDHNSMAFGVEARQPFLDYRLVEFVFALPPRFRINNGTSKWIIRESMRGVVPETIRQYPGKRPFPTPQSAWMSGISKKQIASLLGSNSFRARDFIDVNGAKDIFKEFCDGNSSLTATVWRIVNFETWMRCFNL